MKKQICIGIGTIGSFLIKLVGGWDSLMQTLLIFMIIDYVSGWTVAAVFQNSTKTQNKFTYQKQRKKVEIFTSLP